MSLKRQTQWWWLSGLLLLAAVALAAWQWQRPIDADLVLSCRGELVELGPDGAAPAQFYVQADFLLQGDRANLHYRYFNHSGEALGEIAMNGEILSVTQRQTVYRLNLRQSGARRMAAEHQLPQHMRHQDALGERSKAGEGVHSMTLELLEINQQEDQAIVLFLPSCAVCGCTYTHTG
ncbi:hypothetical protein [Ferrimonas pelagia]|uniref:Uncharacterized protein n=1 Tax=Ferrimonas pelagia TaxID=1177826 RepID=A0ABP9FHS6_9GAMM